MTEYLRSKWRGMNRWARFLVTTVLGLIGAVCLLAAELRIDPAEHGKGHLKLNFHATKGSSSYVQIWATDSLMGEWKVVALDWGQDQGQSWIDEHADDDQRFYKVVEVPLSNPADSDRDGMNDVFEMRHPHLNPLDPSDAKKDVDGDGLLNIQEYQNEKDKGFQKIILDAFSILPVTPAPTIPEFTIYSQYRIRPTDALVGSSHGKNDKRFYVRQTVEILDAAGATVRTLSNDFFIDPTGIKNASEYAALTTSAIWDGKTENGSPVPDGTYTCKLTGTYVRMNNRDKIIGTSEALQDTFTIRVDHDSDGMADWWEEMYLGSADAQPGGDPDEDGVSNLDEYLAQTDPQQKDTDRDGFEDGFEPGYGVSRAFIEWGQPDFTIGDDYVYTMPEWLRRAYRDKRRVD